MKNKKRKFRKKTERITEIKKNRKPCKKSRTVEFSGQN